MKNIKMDTTSSDFRTMIPMIRNSLPTLLARDILGVQPMTGRVGNLWNIRRSRNYNKKYWPYQYKINPENIIQAERWCWDRFKGRYWHSDNGKFVFKRESHAAMFLLKWGE